MEFEAPPLVFARPFRSEVDADVAATHLVDQRIAEFANPREMIHLGLIASRYHSRVPPLTKES